MKLTQKQMKVAIGSSVAGVVIIGLTVVLLSQPKISSFDNPVHINWDAYDLTNVTDQDPSNEMEYYSGTVHLKERSYAIGGIDKNDNILPVIRQLDDTGALIKDYYFGLDDLNMDADTYEGDVVQLRYWEAKGTMLVLVDINPRYTSNGQILPLTGPLGDLLDSEQPYGLYLRLLLLWQPETDELNLLFVSGEVVDANAYYDLLEVIPEEDTILLGFEYDSDQHTIPFEFNNPLVNEDNNDYLIQRFQYQDSNKSISPISGEQWVLASELNEMVYLNPGFNLYEESAAVEGYLTFSVRATLINGVLREDYQAWLDNLNMFGFSQGLDDDIIDFFNTEFDNLDDRLDYFNPSFDAVLILDLETLTVVDYVLEINLPYAAKIYHGELYALGRDIYFLYSIRYYGQDPLTENPFLILKTILYEFNQGGLETLEIWDGEQGFFAEGLVFIKDAIILYGNQYWGLTEEGFPDSEVKLMKYDLIEGDYEDAVLNSSNNDYAYDARVNMTNMTLDFLAYVANADEDFATLVNSLGSYMTVKISYSIV